METPNEKESKESGKSTRKPATGTGSARRTGGLSDNARNPGATGRNKDFTGNSGGISNNPSNPGTTTNTQSSSLNTGSSARTTSYKNNESGTGGKGILTSLGINKGLATAIGAIAGGALLYKGAKAMTGASSKSGSKSVVNIYSKLQVKRPKAELYSYWRNLENLPHFMSHIKEVEEIDNKTSHWIAELPGGVGTIEWDAEIIWEEKNHLLSWKSLPDSEIENSGEVRFEDAKDGKSTYVETTISYRPPAGEIGGIAAKLLNPGFRKVVENDLKEFKKIMEKGRGKR